MIEQLGAVRSTGDEGRGAQNLAMIGQIPVRMQVVVGTATMTIAELMNLKRGAVVALDRRIGEPVDVLVNGRVVLRGDLQVLDGDDGRFGIVVTDVVGAAPNAGTGTTDAA